MRWAMMMGMIVINTTSRAVTFVIGRLRGLSICEKIQIGSVCWLPAVKVVTITSSNESEKARMAPASRAELMLGSTTCQKVWKEFAPRSMEASITELLERRKRAITLLYTTTTQNVAWPITIVQKVKGMCNRLIAERMAMPVTMPGRASGRISTNEIASLPKKLKR